MDAYIIPQPINLNTHLDINLSNVFKQGNATKYSSLERALAGRAVKHCPWAHKGMCSPIFGVPNPDGTLELVGGGYGMAPDTIGYINNNVKQQERKTIIKARLQQKLLQKQMKKE